MSNLLHMRLSKSTVTDNDVIRLENATTWCCYGIFDRLLLMPYNSLISPDWEDRAAHSVGQNDEVLVPLYETNWNKSNFDYPEYNLLAIIQIKFHRSGSPEDRPNRLNPDNIEKMDKKIRKLLGTRKYKLEWTAGLHWHEYVLFLYVNDFDIIQIVSQNIRLILEDVLNSLIHHSKTTIAVRIGDENSLICDGISGNCLGNVHISSNVKSPFDLKKRLESALDKFMEDNQLKIKWNLNTCLGVFDYLLQIRLPIPVKKFLQLIEVIRHCDSEHRVRETETTFLMLSTDKSVKLSRHSKLKKASYFKYNKNFYDDELKEAIDKLKGPTDSLKIRELKSLFRFADAVLCDSFLNIAGFDLINALNYLKVQIFKLSGRNSRKKVNYQMDMEILYRMAQRLEFALRSRVASVGQAGSFGIHPAMSQGSHMLHFRIIEAISSVPQYLLGDKWPGCVLVGWGNAIQLFEGGCFGTPAAWFSQVDDWWAIIHEAGHQYIFDHQDWFSQIKPVIIKTIPALSETEVISISENNREMYLSKIVNLAMEVFSDLYEYIYIWRNWSNYCNNVWRFYNQRVMIYINLYEHLLRAICIKAYSSFEGKNDVFLSRYVDDVIKMAKTWDNIKDHVEKIEKQKNKINLLCQRFNNIFNFLVPRIRKIEADNLSENSSKKTPVSYLESLIFKKNSPKRDNGYEQANTILQMSEWYRSKRKILTWDEISELPSVIDRKL